MAVAPYIARVAQSAQQVLAGLTESGFLARLEATRVAVAWDASVTTSFEARATLTLLVDLLARFYPSLQLVPLDGHAATWVPSLTAQAQQINPVIAVIAGGTRRPSAASGPPSVTVVVGDTAWPAVEQGPVLYVGSTGWTARLSQTAPVGSGESSLPFAAGAAACLAAANVFRACFGAALPRGVLDHEASWSLLESAVRRGHAADAERPLSPDTALWSGSARLDLGVVHLVGLGAIGHGVVWAWRRMAGLAGVVHLIDPESYDDSNAQRYAEMPIGAHGFKVAAVAKRRWAGTDLEIIPHAESWETYAAAHATRDPAFRLDRVVLAVDTAATRVAVQAALPRSIHNAWTQPANLGVSRHDFLAGPCVCCLYMPRQTHRHADEIVAEALGMREVVDIRRVRVLLDTGLPLSAADLDWIGAHLQWTSSHRQQAAVFEGRSINALYSGGVCSAMLLPDAQDDAALRHRQAVARQVEVPLAFQSTLAGILVAAETVLAVGPWPRAAVPPVTVVDLLKPLTPYLNQAHQPPPGGGCLCQDEDFRARYRAKYA